jgi:predicted alpha/beta-fold hydrolase
VSPGPHLVSIDRPTLVLAASDDPFIPEASMKKWARSSAVAINMVEGGGHVGFVGPSRAPRHFWAADRVMGFFEELTRGS